MAHAGTRSQQAAAAAAAAESAASAAVTTRRSNRTRKATLLQTDEPTAADAAPADAGAQTTKRTRGPAKGSILSEEHNPRRFLAWSYAAYDNTACGLSLGNAANRHPGMVKGMDAEERKQANTTWARMRKEGKERTTALGLAKTNIEADLRKMMKASGTVEMDPGPESTMFH